MTILSDVEILRELDAGELRIEVPPEDAAQFGHFNRDRQVQPASVDVRLGQKGALLQSGDVSIDQLGCAMYSPVSLPVNLRPREFILCETLERITVPPSLAAKYEGRSSLGRIAFMSHVTAGFVDPGFAGRLTLEVYNVGSCTIRLVPGVRIGQLVFARLGTPAARPYGHASRGSKYVGTAAASVHGAKSDVER